MRIKKPHPPPPLGSGGAWGHGRCYTLAPTSSTATDEGYRSSRSRAGRPAECHEQARLAAGQNARSFAITVDG